MKRPLPQTQFLLVGVPDCHATPLRHALRGTGATVDFARTVADGRRLMRRNAYDVILLTLGGRNAASLADVAFCRRYNAMAGMVALLAVPGAAPIARIIDHGADDCVTIPFDQDELLARLAALARRVGGRRADGAILRSHDLEIDTAKRTVRRGDRAIALTAREFALLELLARHRGQAVSRQLIRQHLYGALADCDSNVIDVYIRFLRAKLDEGFALPLIVTCWGQGYRLRADDEPNTAARAC